MAQALAAVCGGQLGEELVVRSIQKVPRSPLEVGTVGDSAAGYLLSASLH
jgi:hypothetical protein